MAYKTKAAAMKDARWWRQTMPKGWKIYCWEDIGWHWQLQKAPMIVSPMTGNTFWCLIASRPEDIGYGDQRWSNDTSRLAITPLAAVKKAIRYTKAYIKKSREAFRVLEPALEP